MTEAEKTEAAAHRAVYRFCQGYGAMSVANLVMRRRKDGTRLVRDALKPNALPFATGRTWVAVLAELRAKGFLQGPG